MKREEFTAVEVSKSLFAEGINQITLKLIFYVCSEL